jgi:hypothetical protein
MAKIDPKAFVTNETLDKKLGEVVDTILQGMDTMASGIKTELRTEMANGFNAVDKRLGKVETDIVFIKRDIRDIKIELGNVPTLRQFNELKTKVDRHILAS